MLFVKYAIQFYDCKVFIQETIYLSIYLYLSEKGESKRPHLDSES